MIFLREAQTGPVFSNRVCCLSVCLSVCLCLSVCVCVCYHFSNGIRVYRGVRIFLHTQCRIHKMKVKVPWEYLPTKRPDDSFYTRGVVQHTVL